MPAALVTILVVATANLRWAGPGWSTAKDAADLRRLVDRGVTLIGVQEAREDALRRFLTADPAWAVAGGAWVLQRPGHRVVAVLYRKDLYSCVYDYVSVPIGWLGRLGAGEDRITAKIIAAPTFTVLATGQRFAWLNVHNIASAWRRWTGIGLAEGKRRQSAWSKVGRGYFAKVQQLRAAGIPAGGSGDWNGTLTRLRGLISRGWQWAKYTGRSHAVGAIDQLGSTSPELTLTDAELVELVNSDHHALMATGELRSAAPSAGPKPTTPPKETPMSAYLVDNPPRRRQFRARQAKPTGCIVIHTAESAPDTAGPDTGTDNVARFIRQRSDPGSYHGLADSDSRLRLVPFSMAAYGDGTGSNEFAIHLSLATQAHRWDSLSAAWKDGAIRQLALEARDAAHWVEEQRGIKVPARRISRAESSSGKPGFISHGERDPGRRSDPGADFPWKQFLEEFARLMGDQPKPNHPKALHDELLEVHDRLAPRIDPKRTGARAWAKAVRAAIVAGKRFT